MLSQLKRSWFRMSRRQVLFADGDAQISFAVYVSTLGRLLRGDFPHGPRKAMPWVRPQLPLPRPRRPRHAAGTAPSRISSSTGITRSRPRIARCWRRSLLHPRCSCTIRSLPDTLVSYREHIEKTGHGPLDPHMPGLTEGTHFAKLTDRQQYDYLIKFVMPWYIRFVAGWLEAAHEWNVKFITYEELTNRPTECLREIAEFLGLDGRPSFLSAVAAAGQSETAQPQSRRWRPRPGLFD